MVEKVIKLIDYITAANTIYPQSLREAERRRGYQTQAIITVEQSRHVVVGVAVVVGNTEVSGRLPLGGRLPPVAPGTTTFYSA